MWLQLTRQLMCRCLDILPLSLTQHCLVSSHVLPTKHEYSYCKIIIKYNKGSHFTNCHVLCPKTDLKNRNVVNPGSHGIFFFKSQFVSLFLILRKEPEKIIFHTSYIQKELKSRLTIDFSLSLIICDKNLMAKIMFLRLDFSFQIAIYSSHFQNVPIWPKPTLSLSLSIQVFHTSSLVTKRQLQESVQMSISLTTIQRLRTVFISHHSYRANIITSRFLSYYT